MKSIEKDNSNVVPKYNTTMTQNSDTKETTNSNQIDEIIQSIDEELLKKEKPYANLAYSN